jgi:hypothetical protein
VDENFRVRGFNALLISGVDVSVKLPINNGHRRTSASRNGEEAVTLILEAGEKSEHAK